MQNTSLKKISIFTCAFLLQPLLYPGSFALAKKKAPMKAYSFITEGGKASQEECDGVRKIPRLKRLKEFTKANGYMGSEMQTSDLPGRPGEEMWVHLFRTKPACGVILGKTPSRVEQPATPGPKPELPPDEDADDSESDTE